MKEKMNGERFVKFHAECAQESANFWEKKYMEEVVRAIESTYKREILRDMCIVGITTTHDGDFLIEWKRRIFSLTDQELKDRYGR